MDSVECGMMGAPIPERCAGVVVVAAIGTEVVDGDERLFRGLEG